MSKIAISIQNLSKRYQIGAKRSGSFRETISKAFRRKTSAEIEATEFLALNDVSFEIKKGEAVGIIGRNGAGKSTLLKVLSRITEPTKGRIEINGRVASLLEVGTGFHPELTGRENIFMNGTIMGMTRHEIKDKFDEIVDFSGVEKFIDTPVKHYSSGMYVRLAFAVAAHLEPEILIIDEVLAVGDSVFQKKCIDKMTDVCQEGRTVLFVSHNFSAVRSLCTQALILESGKLIYKGRTEDTIDKYNNEQNLVGKEINLRHLGRQKYAQELKFDKIIFEEMPVPFGEPIRFTLVLKALNINKHFLDLDFGVAIIDKNRTYVIHCSNRFIGVNFNHLSNEQIYKFEIENILKPNTYFISLFLRCQDIIQDWLPEVVTIQIVDGNPYFFNDATQIQGVIFPKFNITTSIRDAVNS